MSNNNSNKESSNNIKSIYYQNKSKRILLNKLKLEKDFTLNNLTKKINEIKKSLPQNIQNIELLQKFKYYTTINGINYKFNSNLKLPISIISSESLTIIPDLYEIEKNNEFVSSISSNTNNAKISNSKNNVEVFGNYLEEYLDNKKKLEKINPQFISLINDMIIGIKSGRDINSYPLLVRLYNTYMKGKSITGILYRIEKEFNKSNYLKKSPNSLSFKKSSPSSLSNKKSKSPIKLTELKEYTNKQMNKNVNY